MTKLMLLLSLQDGESAMMLASENGHTDIVKYRLDSKASLDLQIKVGHQILNPFFRMVQSK